MSKVDTQRVRKPANSKTKKKPKRKTRDEAIAAVKGTGDLLPRWTAHRRLDDGSLDPTFFAVSVDEKEHVVFLAFKLAFDAGRALRLFLSRQGVPLEAIDDLRVKAYAPNGWTPKRAVLVYEHPTIRCGGEIVVEPYDLEDEMEAP
jgi:hypothetical protein